MRYFTFVLLLLVLPVYSSAQLLEGMVLDKESKNSISGVAIQNRKSGAVVFSDNEGNYAIAASAGDTIIFRHTAYQLAKEVMPYTMSRKYLTVLLQARVYKLSEATVTSRTKYQQDSIAMHEVYGHELAKPPVPKPKFTGLAVSGLFGWMADKITGNSKKSKHFKQQFATDDQTKFIDSRYTPELVATLTKVSDKDSIATFMNAYPMPYDFARAATDLEFKSWIRNNYREYKAKLSVKNTTK